MKGPTFWDPIRRGLLAAPSETTSIGESWRKRQKELQARHQASTLQQLVDCGFDRCSLAWWTRFLAGAVGFPSVGLSGGLAPIG
jgi:hypothetical protein